MESFRKMIQSTLGKVFLGIVLVIFVLFAFGTQFLTPPGAQGEEAVVNGQKILSREVDQGVERQMARYGDQIDRKTLEQLIKREDVLTALINQRVMIDAAADAGLVVSKAMVQETILAIDAFKDEKGQFSQDLFQQLVIRNGYSGAPAFLKRVEEEMLAQQVSGGLTDSAFATRQDLEMLTRMGEQTRDLSWVVFSPAIYASGVSVTDEEIQNRYQGDPAGYMTEEQFAVEYLEVNLADYAAVEPVTEAEIKAKYEEMTKSAQQNAERRVAHILIAINKDRDEMAARKLADEVIAKLAAGESFVELAAKYSDDPGSKSKGGDLGFVSRGVLEPALDAELFTLQMNNVSPAVKSAEGLHLLKVLEVSTVDVQPFDEARPEIVAGLGRDKARSRFDALVEELGTLAYESDNLQDPAAKLGLQVRRSGLFGRKGGPGVVGNPKVLKEILSDDVLLEGRNSPMINAAEGQAVVVRMLEHRKSTRRSLAEVSSEIRSALILEKAAAIASEKAKALRDVVQGGMTLDQAAAQNGLAVQRAMAISRADQQVPREMLKAAFSLKRPANDSSSVDLVEMQSGARAVIAVRNVVDGTLLGVDPMQVADRRGQLAGEFGNQDFRRWLDHAVASADVTRVRTSTDDSLGIIEKLTELKQSFQRP